MHFGLFPARTPGTPFALIAPVLARALLPAAGLKFVFLKRHTVVLILLDRKVGHVVGALERVAFRQHLCLPSAPVFLVCRQPAAHIRDILGHCFLIKSLSLSTFCHLLSAVNKTSLLLLLSSHLSLSLSLETFWRLIFLGTCALSTTC